MARPSLKDVTISREEMKKLERKLPAIARAKLKHLRKAAADASALNEARWLQQQNAVEKRSRLKAALANAESDFRIEFQHHGHKKSWREQWGAYYQGIVDEAREALTDHDRERDSAEFRAPDEGGLAGRCEAFIIRNPNAVWNEVVAPLPKGDLGKALVATREKIAAAIDLRGNIDLAPLTVEEAMREIDRDIARFAAAGMPDLFGPTRFLQCFGESRSQGNTEWPEQTLVVGNSIRKIPDGFSSLFWAFADLLRPKLEEAVRARIAESRFEPISIADRESRKIELAAELLELERTEESIIAALQDSGDKNFVRRHDADPRALLCVEIAGTNQVKHTGPGSLVVDSWSAPPNAEDQKPLTRSEWMNKGH